MLLNEKKIVAHSRIACDADEVEHCKVVSNDNDNSVRLQQSTVDHSGEQEYLLNLSTSVLARCRRREDLDDWRMIHKRTDTGEIGTMKLGVEPKIQN